MFAKGWDWRMSSTRIPYRGRVMELGIASPRGGWCGCGLGWGWGCMGEWGTPKRGPIEMAGESAGGGDGGEIEGEEE